MPHRHHFLARPLVLLAVFAGASLLPVTATAQLGKLKKAAADAAKEKAGVKTDAPANNATSGAGTSNYTITADRLSAVMTVMQASMDDATKAAATRAMVADYNAKKKTFDACVETQTTSLGAAAVTAPSPAAMQRSADMSQQAVTLMQRATAAQQAKRYREFVATTDTMTALSTIASLAAFSLDTKCGKPLYKPAAMLDMEAATMARAASSQYSNSSAQTSVPTAQRAGMTSQQFGMVRERMALWALQQTNNAPVGNNKYGVFTNDEQAVLEAQSATLKKWALVFKDQPALWATWADLQSW